MNAFLDSSVVLRRVLGQPGAFLDWSQWQEIIVSELLRVEVLRSLDRIRLKQKLRDEDLAERVSLVRSLLQGARIVPLDARILERAASPFSTLLGTLDAIHLATALLWTQEGQKELLFLTHDSELGQAALACGLRAITRT